MIKADKASQSFVALDGVYSLSTLSGLARAARNQPFQLGYVPALDGVRALAVLAVLAFHALIPYSRAGLLGVDVFFVLSGLLITSILFSQWEARGQIDFKRFYARRALRLFPALCLMLIAYAFLIGPAIGKNSARTDSLLALLYVSNWMRALTANDLGGIGHTWSLSIEEQFYLIWPVTLALILRYTTTRPTRIAKGLYAAACGITVYKAALYLAGFSLARIYNGFDTRADALLVGCATAFLLRQQRWHAQAFRWPWLAGALAVIAWALLWFTYRRPAFYLGGTTLFAFAIAYLLALIVLDPQGRHQQSGHQQSGAVRMLSLPPLVWIGRISYGVYLWHYPIYYLVDQWGWAYWPGLAVKLALIFGIATVSFYLVERPLLRLAR